jgi:hypothetical protein
VKEAEARLFSAASGYHTPDSSSLNGPAVQAKGRFIIPGFSEKIHQASPKPLVPHDTM